MVFLYLFSTFLSNVPNIKVICAIWDTIMYIIGIWVDQPSNNLMLYLFHLDENQIRLEQIIINLT
jgi:hypothetical protein